jgi:hypothetical protein
LRPPANPEYNEILGYFNKKDLIKYGVPVDIGVVESNIKIRRSIFKNNVEFSLENFTGYVDFYGSTFYAPVDFSNSFFNDSVSFDLVSFNAPANVHVHRPLAVTFNETPEEFHISTGLR